MSPELNASGKTEDGQKYVHAVVPDSEINVGLNYASLQDTITRDDVGSDFHIAFDGWGETKKGDRFRMFAVLELGDDATLSVSDNGDVPFPTDDDDSLPF